MDIWATSQASSFGNQYSRVHRFSMITLRNTEKWCSLWRLSSVFYQYLVNASALLNTSSTMPLLIFKTHPNIASFKFCFIPSQLKLRKNLFFPCNLMVFYSHCYYTVNLVHVSLSLNYYLLGQRSAIVISVELAPNSLASRECEHNESMLTHMKSRMNE